MFGSLSKISLHKTKKKSSWLLLGIISTVLASDAPPATLPKGFLEALPILESFKDHEFESFLQFVKQDKQFQNEQVEQDNNKSTVLEGDKDE